MCFYAYILKERLGASGGLIVPPTPDHHPYLPFNLTDLIQNYYELHRITEQLPNHTNNEQQ